MCIRDRLNVDPARVSLLIELLGEFDNIMRIVYSYTGFVSILLLYRTPSDIDAILEKLKESDVKNYTVYDSVHVKDFPFRIENYISRRVTPLDH